MGDVLSDAGSGDNARRRDVPGRQRLGRQRFRHTAPSWDESDHSQHVFVVGDLSPHFDSSEFVDRRSGQKKGPPIGLVTRLEALRSRIGRPLPILSGYRTPASNRAVGGARSSRHIRGDAVDIPTGLVTVDQAVADGFTGIGFCGRWVVHLDIRPATRPVIFRDC